ncbi:hypothetical protein VTN00DRAFT_7597 [Thermoascus crustaceus]|uniref:uncharacterized protein n=1 Tax=Thermoascus crustaceus TaxID=5088 RepID=UPI00374283CE
MAPAAAAPYLLSKIGDPIFAILIGTSAAFVRIRREQREQHPEKAQVGEIGFGSILETGSRRLRMWWNGEFEGL